MLIENAILQYYHEIRKALVELRHSDERTHDSFDPGIALPDLDADVRDYLSVSTLSHLPIGDYKGHALSLLDLTRNPATRTTKTFASLVIVARAVQFIRETGQRVTIVTPSSANKAVALRDAVLRAIHCGLVGAHELNIVTLVPEESAHKLRNSELATEPDLRRRNPLAVYGDGPSGAVKEIAGETVTNYRSQLEGSANTNIWYTLKLENYLAADVIRACAERDFFPGGSGRRRLHAHAVSSAYGLLGHAYGRQLFTSSSTITEPGYLLVQHLGAPDMVLGLYRGTDSGFDTAPDYTYDQAEGLYRQGSNPHFPVVTFDPSEVLDTTFYTRNPATITKMNSLVRDHGGTGIVVSLAECLQRFGNVRALLGEAGLEVPANPSHVHEWSLPMAVVGVLNAIDRKLVDTDDIVIHGSGIYSREEMDLLGSSDVHQVGNSEELRDLILKATELYPPDDRKRQ